MARRLPLPALPAEAPAPHSFVLALLLPPPADSLAPHWPHSLVVPPQTPTPTPSADDTTARSAYASAWACNSACSRGGGGGRALARIRLGLSPVFTWRWWVADGAAEPPSLPPDASDHVSSALALLLVGLRTSPGPVAGPRVRSRYPPTAPDPPLNLRVVRPRPRPRPGPLPEPSAPGNPSRSPVEVPLDLRELPGLLLRYSSPGSTTGVSLVPASTALENRSGGSLSALRDRPVAPNPSRLARGATRVAGNGSEGPAVGAGKV